MHWQYIPYVLPLAIAAAISVALALCAWRRRPASGATPFALLMLAVAAWTLGYALELASADLPSKLFWSKASYLGVGIVPVAWLIFVLQYTGREKWLTGRNVAMLAIEPFITLLLIWTNERHGLFYSNVGLDTSGPFLMLDLTHGMWFWVDVAYSNLLLLLSTLLLIQTFICSPYLYRRQTGILLISAFIPWTAESLLISGLSPFYPLDLTPFAFALSGLVVAWGLFRFRLLDIVPVAYHAIVKGMTDAVIVLDARNRIVDLNPAARRIIGHSAAEVIGQPAAQVLSGQPDLVERYRGVTEAHEEIVLGEGEAQRYFDLRISPLHDWRGRLTGRLVVLRDITEHKQAEDELRKSEQKYRDLVENINDIIYTVDENGMITYISPSVEWLTGYSPSEIIGRSFVELLHREEDVSRVVRQFREALSGRLEPSDYCLVTKSGEVRWVSSSSRPIVMGDRATGLRGRMTDITERKRAEREIEERQLYLEGVLGAAPDAIVTLDARQRIVEWNSGAEKLFGYSRDEAIGQNIDELITSPDVYEEAVGLTQVIMGGGEVPLLEIIRYRKDGSPVDVIAAGSPILVGDELIGAVAVYTDITERRRAEEALQEYAERLEEMVEERTKELRDAQERLVRKEKLAIMGQLAGGIAHELRNPLGAISNAVYYLKMVLPDAEEDVKESLEIIARTVRDSDGIISDLVDFSRTRAPDREEVAVPELVAQVLEKQPPPEKVEVTAQIAADLPPVYVDRRQMGQVLGNLVSNAYQAMPEGGELTISAQVEEGEVTLSVADTGVGISEENMATLFEPLFTTKAKGLGLGLMVVKNLVEANGGSIEVESEVGKGSTFRARLPVVSEMNEDGE